MTSTWSWILMCPTTNPLIIDSLDIESTRTRIELICLTITKQKTTMLLITTVHSIHIHHVTISYFSKSNYRIVYIIHISLSILHIRPTPSPCATISHNWYISIFHTSANKIFRWSILKFSHYFHTNMFIFTTHIIS